MKTRGKGGKFERKVCKSLSRWIAPNSKDTLFWRSAMSGGRATVQRKKGVKNTSQSGDLSCIHPDGQWLTDMFVVECKFWKDLDIASGMLFGTGKLVKFWAQACDQADHQEKHPLLIARQNNTPTLVLFSVSGHNAFIKMGHQAPSVAITYKLGKKTAIVCRYDEVFKVRKPKVKREPRG